MSHEIIIIYFCSTVNHDVTPTDTHILKEHISSWGCKNGATCITEFDRPHTIFKCYKCINFLMKFLMKD